MAASNTPEVKGRNAISGEGVELNQSSGHVVCYNSISVTADAISYPRRNCDLYGNDIFDVTDDGLETDRGWANVRCWVYGVVAVSDPVLLLLLPVWGLLELACISTGRSGHLMRVFFFAGAVLLYFLVRVGSFVLNLIV